MRKSFKDSLKALEADIQLANTLASDHPQEYDGGCLQMRLAYSPAAHLFLFLIQWTDCHFAGSLGLLRILIYKAYVDGKTTMSIQERRASIKEFYASKKKESAQISRSGSGIIFPTLLQLHKGISDVEERKQRELCASKYNKLNECDRGKQVEIDSERDEECGICMEICSKIVLPLCLHSMCMKCYHSWRTRSQSCPFCRDSLKRVNSRDLWIYTSQFEIVDQGSIAMENMRTLIMFVGTLPLAVPDTMHVSCGPCYQ